MDPITLIVAAVAAGVSAGLKDTAAAGIKDAYAGLRRLITDRFGAVDVTPVEKRPESEAKRRSLEEDLAQVGAGGDDEILEAARRVIDEVRKHDPGAAAAIGIDLDRSVVVGGSITGSTVVAGDRNVVGGASSSTAPIEDQEPEEP